MSRVSYSMGSEWCCKCAQGSPVAHVTKFVPGENSLAGNMLNFRKLFMYIIIAGS
jgi:hypothetical protein